jgi:hypothetical protein
MFLVNIFVTPSGNVNLLNYFENFMAGENSYRLHRSDSTFNTGEQLFEFEGTEKYESDNGLYMDHPLARQTLWSQDGNYFYMLNSHQSEWQKRNLMTDTIDTVAYTHQTDRNNSARSKAYLAGRLEPVIGVEPDVKELIDESDDLPLNHNMFASEDWIVIPTFYAGGSEKIVVLYNQTSKETAYCSVPAHFFPVAFDGDELIGKNSGSEGEIRLEILEVELPG